jgi:hypothetical protein
MAAFVPLTFTFTEDWRGHAAFLERMLERHPAIRRLARADKWYRFTSSIPYLILAVAFVLAIFAKAAPDLWPVAIIIGAMVWCMYHIWISRQGRPWARYLQTIREQISSWTSTATTDVAITITIHDEGVSATSEEMRQTLFWSMFDDIVTIEACGEVYVVLVYCRDVRGVCFPRRALGDESQAAAAIASIRELMVTKGVHESVRVRQVFAEEHFLCRCGHDLFGLTSGRCPECGKLWTHFDLRMEQAERQYRAERWSLLFSPSKDIECQPDMVRQ